MDVRNARTRAPDVPSASDRSIVLGEPAAHVNLRELREMPRSTRGNVAACMVALGDCAYASDMEEHAFAIGEAGYPEPLRRIDDPPAVLYARGRLARGLAEGAAIGPAVAIVGARDATAYGLAVARDLGGELARRGFAVVSGLALGVDGAAHRGALDAGGLTIAVVGAGTDVVYPRAHGRLRADILASGAVVGELPAGTRAFPQHFPALNRIISGLALGVIVVEATMRSGSLSTARHALEQGREVF